ncbi:MAG: hypothetical protein IIY93_05645, partial [Clostridia bacterium]|nr:hypothetical protein [Clostridia bacterium]
DDESGDAAGALGRIRHREDDENAYFNAVLWGAPLSAAKDAVICFYSITRDGNGVITDADFNFISRAEFEKTYDIL